MNSVKWSFKLKQTFFLTTRTKLATCSLQVVLVVTKPCSSINVNRKWIDTTRQFQVASTICNNRTVSHSIIYFYHLLLISWFCFTITSSIGVNNHSTDIYIISYLSNIFKNRKENNNKEMAWRARRPISCTLKTVRDWPFPFTAASSREQIRKTFAN